MFNTTTIGMGLGNGANRLLAWGLGSFFGVVIHIVPSKYISSGSGGGAADGRRTYLFGAFDVVITVNFQGQTHEKRFTPNTSIVKIVAWLLKRWVTKRLVRVEVAEEFVSYTEKPQAKVEAKWYK